MFAAKLATLPGISPTLAKGILAAGLAATNIGLVDLVAQGFITGAWAVIATAGAGFITAVALLIDPNASHEAA